MQNVIGKRKTDTTTIKLTENYRNDRTTYKLNSGLFSDTTAQRFVFYFFSHRTKYFEILPAAHWHIWFCPNRTSRHTGKTKRANFATAPNDSNGDLKLNLAD